MYHFFFQNFPGALMRFLDPFPEGHDITFLHYCKHGVDFGCVLRVLVDVGHDFECEEHNIGSCAETRLARGGLLALRRAAYKFFLSNEYP